METGASLYDFSALKGKNALVAGGLGFMGSNVAHALVKAGAKVTVYDACLDPYGWNFANIKEIRNTIEFIKGDTRNPDAMKMALKGKDVVFDCAAQVSHILSMKDPFIDMDINCRGALTLLEAARTVCDGATLIYCGTRGEIGKAVYSPVDEKHPTDPMDVYGINKLAAEKYYLLYGKRYGMKSTSLRLTNTYGERGQVRHGEYGILNWFVRLALENKDIVINGPGLQTRDYLYVGDAVEALLLAAAKSEKSAGEVFMVGSGKEVRFIDMCNLVVKLAGSKSKIISKEWDPERKAIEVGDFVISNGKITKALGWKPSTRFEDGLKKTIDFYRQRMKEYTS